jgi:predicted ester cyclase
MIESVRKAFVTLREFQVNDTGTIFRCGNLGNVEIFEASSSLTVNNGVPAVGRNAITEVARSFMTAFPDMCVVMDELLAHGDRIEYRWTLSGTSTGPGGAGQQVRISGFEPWQIAADGLIASSQGHFDETEYRRQLEQGF